MEYDADEAVDGNNLAKSLNRTTDTAGAEVGYRLTPLTQTFVRFEASRYRFHLSPERDADTVAVLPGFTFRPRALLAGTATVGYRRFEGLDEALPSFSGAVASVDLTSKQLASWQGTVAVDRDLDYSFDVREPYYVVTGITGSVSRAIAGGVSAGLGAGRFNYNYRRFNDPNAADEQPARVDEVTTYFVSVTYRLNRLTTFGGRVAFERRRSTVDRSYSGCRIGTEVGYGF